MENSTEFGLHKRMQVKTYVLQQRVFVCTRFGSTTSTLVYVSAVILA